MVGGHDKRGVRTLARMTRQPPVGMFLMMSLLFYAALCVYGLAQI